MIPHQPRPDDTDDTRTTRPARLDLDQLQACVHELVDAPDRLLAKVHAEIPEQPATGYRDRAGRGQGGAKVTGSPAPWNDEAAGLAFDIHAAARRHELTLTLALFSRARYRDGSDEQTRAALLALPELVVAYAARWPQDALVQRVAERIARDITSWPRRCRLLLDEARWGEEPWVRAPGGLRCPHCSRPLRLQPGWEHQAEPPVWCLRCPAEVDEHGEPSTLSWPTGAWLAVLQQGDPASA